MSFQDYAQSSASKMHIGTVRPQMLIGAAVIVVAILGMLAFGSAQLLGAGSFEVADAQPVPEEDAEAGAAARTEAICVHVTGCVAIPGVCYLDEGARVSDAIDAAGGFTEDAAASSINLARMAQDGEQIVVPSIEEAAAQAAAASEPSTGGTAQGGASTASQSDKVNLNTADMAQLQTLSGVGESKARKIIAYREQNGPFKSVDDLMNVSGIGEKTLESLRDSICV